MAEALQNLELSALYFDARLLLLGGIVIVVVGLCVCLGGLRWLGLIAAGIGAIAGLIGAHAFAASAPAITIIFAAIAAAFAAFVKKPVIILSGAAGAAALTWLFFAAPSLRSETLHAPVHPATALGFADTASALYQELFFWGETFLGAVKRASALGWAAGATAALAVVAAAFMLARLVTALTCAWLGTLCIFGGMIMLLLYKGARPLTYIHNKAGFFGLVVLAMIGFGTLSQLFLCPVRASKPHKKRAGKGGSK